MGYAEGTLLALTVGTMLALRSRSWWWAAVLGLAAGATRPLGVLLVLPAAIEAMRGWRGAPPSRHVARVAAVVGPAVGFGAFFAWVGWRYGDALAPLRVQQQGKLRGGFADPLRTFAHDASLLAHGRHLGSALHLPWALLAIGLLIVPCASGRSPTAPSPPRSSWSRSRRRTSTASSATPCRRSPWCWPVPAWRRGPGWSGWC